MAAGPLPVPRRLAAAALLAAVLSFGLAMVNARTERPGVDEGLFADPGSNLWQNGKMGSRLVDDWRLKGIHEHTYWVHPLHLLTQAAWYTVTGFSLFSLRALSTLWGMVGLASWYVVARRLLPDYPAAAPLGVILLSLDYLFLIAASWGRMDMMTAALGFSSYAAYLWLRERNLSRAILCSQTLAMLSGLTHPNGIMHFAALLVLTLSLDRKELRWKHLLPAAVPYVAGAVGWGLYILESPGDFLIQYRVNAADGDRFRVLREPWRALAMEWERYQQSFGLGTRGVARSDVVRLKVLILAMYVCGLVGALAIPALRRHRGCRVLLAMFAAIFLMLTIIDGQKAFHYLIHLVPFYVTFVALTAIHVWNKGRWAAAATACALAGAVALQAGGLAYRTRQNTYANGYEPAIRFLKERHRPGQTVWASPAFGFGLGFNTEMLMADGEIGFRRPEAPSPDFIVLDEEMQTNVDARRNYPFGAYVERLLRNYSVGHDRLGFRIYVRER